MTKNLDENSGGVADEKSSSMPYEREPWDQFDPNRTDFSPDETDELMAGDCAGAPEESGDFERSAPDADSTLNSVFIPEELDPSTRAMLAALGDPDPGECEDDENAMNKGDPTQTNDDCLEQPGEEVVVNRGKYAAIRGVFRRLLSLLPRADKDVDAAAGEDKDSNADEGEEE